MAGPWLKYQKKTVDSEPLKPWERFSQVEEEPTPPSKPRTRREMRERSQSQRRQREEKARKLAIADEKIASGDISAQNLTPAQVEEIQSARIKQIPELAEVGVSGFADTSGLEGFGATMAAMSALDPKEVAQIISTQFPQIGMVQTPDNQFILVNNETGEAVNVNKPGLSAMDVIQGAGLMAAFAPSGRIAGLGGKTIAGQAGAVGAASGVTESALQALQAAAGGKFDVSDVGLSATLGGATEAAIPIVRSAFKQRAQARQAQSITPEQQARKELIEETLEVPATRAQVTQRPSEFQLQQETIKGSEGPLRQTIDLQTEAIEQRLIDAAEQTGGTFGRTDSSAVNEVVNRSLDLDKKVSDIYRQVRETLPQESTINVGGLKDTLKKLDPLDTLSNGTVTALKSEAERLGFLGKPRQRITAAGVIERRNLKTPGQAEALRIFASSLFEGANPKGREVIRRFKDDLDKMVLKGAGQDFFEQARNAKSSFEQGLTRAGVSKFDKRGKNLVRDMLENKSPDNFIVDVLNKAQWRKEDIKQLKSYLEQTESGKNALNDIKADAFEYIRSKSFNAKGELNGATMIRTIDNMKGKLNQLLSKDEKILLDRLKEVVKIRTPPRAEVMGRGPSAQAISMLNNRFPIIGPVFNELSDWRKNRLLLRLPEKLKETMQIPESAFIPPEAAQLSRIEEE